jgi:F0F1-type ATP synthase membrane subunit b/b'
MLAFFFNFLFLLASAAAPGTSGGAQTGWQQVLNFWENYMNVPGFELWKFINLGIFILALYLVLRKPLSSGFKAKREQIRAELIKAQQERDAAMKKLQEVEGRLAMLDTEVISIKEKAAADAETEKARIAAQTGAG